MRLLCSFAGGAGHLVPQLPLLAAAREAGHVVDVVGRESALTALPPGLAEAARSRPDPRAERDRAIGPIVETTRAHERAVVGRYFAADLARTSLAEVTAHLTQRPADLVICDEVDFGARLAAEAAEIPCAVVGVMAAGSLVLPSIVAEPLGRLRAELGLVPDPAAARIVGDLWASPFPPAFRDPAFPLPDGALTTRPGVMPGRSRPDPSSPPLVYATLGTEFNTESGDLFDRILSALGSLSVRAVLTVGRDLEPSRFHVPDNVRIERHVDLAGLLPDCAAVVSHGGSGGVTSAIAYGLPQIVLPLGADQSFNADRVADLGIGRSFDALRVTPDELADGIAELLADEEARERTRALRSHWAKALRPAIALRELERLVA